ncbi:MAG: phosphotransferase family protein [Porticoccaceae bacterium]
MSQVDTLNEQRLAAYLESHVEGFRGPLKASKFSGGQSNPTFRIDAASGSYVLRRQPPGELLKSAHAVDREYRVLKALSTTEVPVAKVYHLCEDREVIGSMFYLMEFCQGNIHWGFSLQDIESNQLRSQMYDEINRVLAAIHCVDLSAVGLTDYGRPGNYFQRQYDRWSKQYWASELQPIPEMNALISWLGDNLPEDDGKVSLVHGDFKLDNLMFSPDNQRIIAVLDWELSTLGHPYADLAYQCMCMRSPASSIKNAMSGLGGVDAAALGIPSEQQYIASYCQRVGIDKIDNWNFYMAFSIFRMAAIAQGVAKRATQGNASSKTAHEIGATVQPTAAMAMELIA